RDRHSQPLRRASVTRTLASLMLGAGLFALIAPASDAGVLTKLGVGAYSGINIPIVQDDAGSGALYGFRGRIGLPIVTIEPAVTFLQNKDQDVDAGGSTITLEAPEVTSYGFSALIGGTVYGLAGIGWSSLNVPGGTGETTEPTYFFGGG